MEEVHTADIFGGLGKSGEQKKKKMSDLKEI